VFKEKETVKAKKIEDLQQEERLGDSYIKTIK
jgi:hypothetical protein